MLVKFKMFRNEVLFRVQGGLPLVEVRIAADDPWEQLRESCAGELRLSRVWSLRPLQGIYGELPNLGDLFFGRPHGKDGAMLGVCA